MVLNNGLLVSNGFALWVATQIRHKQLLLDCFKKFLDKIGIEEAKKTWSVQTERDFKEYYNACKEFERHNKKKNKRKE